MEVFSRLSYRCLKLRTTTHLLDPASSSSRKSLHPVQVPSTPGDVTAAFSPRQQQRGLPEHQSSPYQGCRSTQACQIPCRPSSSFWTSARGWCSAGYRIDVFPVCLPVVTQYIAWLPSGTTSPVLSPVKTYAVFQSFYVKSFRGCPRLSYSLDCSP